MKKTYIIIAVIVAAVVALFLLFGSSSLVVNKRDPSKVYIKIVVIPLDTSVTLDGKKVSSGENAISKGQHTLVASRQYFDTITKIINTKDLKNDDSVYLVPGASSKAAQDWLTAHPGVQAQREQYSSLEYDRQQSSVTTDNPILTQLPYQTPAYKVDYSIAADNTVSFQVTVYPLVDSQTGVIDTSQIVPIELQAKAFLSKNGVNTDKANIQFTVSR